MKIVKRGNKYFIRRGFIFYNYLSVHSRNWWSNKNSDEFCAFNTLEEAIYKMDAYKERLVSNKEIQKIRSKNQGN